MLASYTVNEFGDSFAIVALAVLVYDRTARWRPPRRCSSAGEVPARASSRRSSPRGSTSMRPAHAAAALRVEGGSFRRTRAVCAEAEFSSSRVALASVTARSP
jgi:hypothetical protein